MLFLKRILLYAGGLLCLSFGVAFSVNSNLGISPVNSLPYIVSQITGYDMGCCVTSIFSLYVFIQFLILRKAFQWINLTQILFSMLFGYFVDFSKWVLGDFTIPTYLGQLMMLLVSILFVATGVCAYMNVKLVNMPMEGMTHAIARTFFPDKEFHQIKIFIDCAVVVLGMILSILCLGKLEGIREGTIICAVLVGRIMKQVQKIVLPVHKMILEV